MSISAAFFAQAQDISVIRNTTDVYSASLNSGSARFNAMAGSNGALGGDANSLSTNPAGLGVAISGEISGTLSVTGNKNTSSYAGASRSYTVNKGDIGNIGATMTFQLMSESAWKFINIGVNYSNQSIEDYIETPGSSKVNTIEGPTNDYSLGKHAYDRYGYLSKTSFGVGANYNNNFYIGAGLNFLNASIDQSDTATLISAANGLSDNFSKQNTPFSERGNGFSASLGVIGKLNQNFRIGAALETPTFWNIDRNYAFYNDPYDGDDYGAENRKMSSPLKATVSAAFIADKSFSLNVDYTLGLTKPHYTVYGPTETVLNDFFKDHSKNMSEVKIGAEYRIKQFRLRGGYSYASNPFNALNIDRYDNNGNMGAQTYNNLILGNRNAASVGIGYDFRSFYIDASYQNYLKIQQSFYERHYRR